jgi:hypothetical protein
MRSRLFLSTALVVRKTAPFRFSNEETPDLAADLSCDVPFKFTGKLDKIVIDMK